MKRIIGLLCVILFSYSAFGFDQAANKQVAQQFCFKSPAEIDVGNNLYTLGSNSEMVEKLQGGNAQGVIDVLGDEMSINVLMLYSQLKYNPCKLPPKVLNRIYPMLRVIAAKDHLSPIQKIDENKEVLKILDEAIADNPKHYQQMLDRYKH